MSGSRQGLRILSAAAIALLLIFSSRAQSQQQAVRLNVMVTDKEGRPVEGLKQEQFQVTEDGVQQTITGFSAEEPPLLYGIVMDNSGSMRSQIDHLVKAAQKMVNGNREGDETFIIRFIDSEKIETVLEPTPNKAKLSAALEKLFIEGGNTALVDAVYLSVQKAASHAKSDRARRRAIILLSDGEERNSFYKKDQLFKLLLEHNVQIFTIGMVGNLDDSRGPGQPSNKLKATDFLKKLAKETGGMAFFPKTRELQQVADEILMRLRKQYVIEYVPANTTDKKGARKISVAVTNAAGDKLEVTTRTGYAAKGK